MMIAAVLVLISSVAIADEVEDAHRLAVTGRDSCWNCLAREYPRDTNKAMSEQDFTSLITRVHLRAAEFPHFAGRLPHLNFRTRRLERI